MNTELAVQRLLEQVRQEAANSNLSKVTEVRLKLGCWENIDEKDLTDTFDRFKSGDLLSDACLVIDKKKPLAKCRYCGSFFEAAYLKSRCKQCGSNYIEFIGDRGITLERIEGVE